jgi:hypothetical protein
MALFTARQDKVADYCRQQVQRADVYVGIIGFRYGSLVKDDAGKRSYVELEFDAAAEKGLTQLIFLLDEDATLPLPKKYLSDPDHEKQQTAFRARVKRAGTMVRQIDSPETLKTLLLQALLELPDTPAAKSPRELPRSIASHAANRSSNVALCPLSSRLSRLCREVFPGQADDVDFFGGWLVRARCLKSCGDEDPAEFVQRRVLAQPGGPGDAGRELVQLAAGVGRVSGHVDVPAGQRAGDGCGHPAGQPQPGRGAGALG